MNFVSKLQNVSKTAVFWTWIFNGLRLGSAVLLLPILYKKLSEADLSMHITWVYLTSILVLLDATVALGIARNVAYAMRGVKKLQPLGLSEEAGSGTPNVELLGRLLGATRKSYFFVSLVVFLFLSSVGTWLVFQTVDQTSSPFYSWIAWALLLFSAPLEVFTGAHLVFLRGMNQVLLTARISTVVYGVKLLLSCSLLLANFGLLAVPLATLAAAILQRILALHYSRKLIPAAAHDHASGDTRELVAVLWPTTWRFGLQLISNYVAVVGCITVANQVLGLENAAPFNVSLQILYTVCQGMASVWTSVKWPIISQMRAAHDFAGLKKTLWPRIWLQNGTYLLMAGFIIAAGPMLLQWWDPKKSLLPREWLCLLALHAFLEMHFSVWTTLLSAENKIPSLWSTFATNLAGFGLAVFLLLKTDLGVGSLVLGPFLCAALFIFWYWPYRGARSIGATWFRFMFARPPSAR
ncbi:MAG: hypothetical protein ACO1QB_14650 [Verrucomicrobiales bacterium]